MKVKSKFKNQVPATSSNTQPPSSTSCVLGIPGGHPGKNTSSYVPQQE